MTLPHFTSSTVDLQWLLDALTDAAVIVDTEQHPLAWNRAYVDLAGLRPRRFLGVVQEGARCRDFLELGICDDQCLMKRSLEAKRSVRMDEIPARAVHVKEKNDHVFIVSAVPIESRDSRTIAVLETYRDVTGEVRIQDRYKALLAKERERAETLEGLVRARTADLEQSLEELKRTRDRLIQSEKLSSLGRLVAGLAHELNNPINFISGNAGFLREYVNAFRSVISAYDSTSSIPESDRKRIATVRKEADVDFIDEDIEKVVDAIQNGAARASGLIANLRKFVQGGAENMSVQVDIAAAVEGTINLAKHKYRGQIEFHCTATPGIPSVRGSSVQLNQVFMNLIMNAIEAIEGEGKVEASITEQGEGVRVIVQDTGTGIAPEHLDRVFEPFFTTKPVGKGTGLGLSLSYSIVEAHGGTLSVESKKGEGATFTMWVPFEAPAIQ